MNILDILPTLFGKLMYFIYYFLTFENYGFALIVFTFLTRLAMLPLTIKQYRGTAKMQRLAPRLEEIRRQYGSDKQRMNEETMKLYQQEKVNPAGGCLPLLIQMPILLSLYPVVTQPLHYIVGKTKETITALQTLYATLSGSTAPFVQEVEVMTFFKNNTDAMAQAEAAGLLRPSELLNLNFFGLDLSRIPTYKPDLLFGDQMGIYLPLLLMPIIGVVSTFVSGKISMASTAAQNATNQQASSMNKSMQLLGPVMTLIFSFQLPAGVLVYWIAGYIIQIAQQLYINKFVLKLDNILTGEGGSSVMLEEDRAARMKAAAERNALKAAKNGNGAEGAADAAGTDGTTGAGTAGATGAVAEIAAAGNSAAAGAPLLTSGGKINKVTGVGVSGGAASAGRGGKAGLVHGGVLETKVRIPGLINPSDEGLTDSPDGADEVDGAYGADGEDNDAARPRSRGADTRSSTNRNYGSTKHKKKR